MAIEDTHFYLNLDLNRFLPGKNSPHNMETLIISKLLHSCNPYLGEFTIISAQ